MDEAVWLVGSLYLVMIPLDRFLPGSLRSSLAGHIVTITFKVPDGRRDEVSWSSQ